MQVVERQQHACKFHWKTNFEFRRCCKSRNVVQMPLYLIIMCGTPC